MQITIDIEDNADNIDVVNKIITTLEKYKNQGVKIRKPLFFYEDEADHKSSKHTSLNNSVGDSFNKILGDYARERVNISIGEDRRLYQEHLLRTSSVSSVLGSSTFKSQLPTEALIQAKEMENRLDKIRNATPLSDEESEKYRKYLQKKYKS